MLRLQRKLERMCRTANVHQTRPLHESLFFPDIPNRYLHTASCQILSSPLRNGLVEPRAKSNPPHELYPHLTQDEYNKRHEPTLPELRC